MTTFNPTDEQITPQQLQLRIQLDQEYQSEIELIERKVQSYLKNEEEISVQPNSVEIIGATREKKQELLNEISRVTESSPVKSSIYVVVSPGLYRPPILAAFDYQHKDFQRKTDVLFVDELRELNAGLLLIAKKGDATILSLSAIGRIIGTPSLTRYITSDSTPYVVFTYLKQDGKESAPCCKALTSFLTQLRDAFPNSPYLKVAEAGELVKLSLNSAAMEQTGVVYTKHAQKLPKASVGIPQMEGFVFHQFLFSYTPPLFKTDQQTLQILDELAKTSIPTFNTTLYDGLRSMKDERFYLSNQELSQLRTAVEAIIWNEVELYVSLLRNSIETMVESIQYPQPITESFMQKILSTLHASTNVQEFFIKIFPYIQKEIETSYISALETTNQMIRLRSYFESILSRITGIQPVALADELSNAMEYFQRYYTDLSQNSNRTVRLLPYVNGSYTPIEEARSHIPDILSIHGFFDLMIAFAANYAYQKNRHHSVVDIIFQTDMVTINKTQYFRITILIHDVTFDPSVIQRVNEPLLLPEDISTKDIWVLKQFQRIVSIINKVNITTKPGSQILKELFTIGNLKDLDPAANNTGCYFTVCFLPLLETEI